MKLLKVIGIAIPVLFFGACAVMVAQFVHKVTRPPEIAEGVASVDWLPAEATDISYCRSYGFTAFEFKISEAGFREWAAAAAYQSRESVEFLPITEISELTGNRIFPIERYNSYGEAGRAVPAGVDYNEHRKATTIDIKNGLRGEMRRGSAGGYSIGYDRDTGMAYWQSNPR